MKIKVLYEKRALILHDHELNSIAHGPEEASTRRFLVLGDLHIGFEEKFHGSGVRLESNQERMTSELVEIVEQNSITDLVINGDVKSGVDRILKTEWENVPKFFAHLKERCRITVVPGNHDGGLAHLLPSGVDLVDVNGLLLSDSLILHGHTKPLAKYANCERIIMGHVHPIFQRKGNPLSGQPVWIFLKLPRKTIFKEVLDESPTKDLVEVILMPSFNLDLVVSGYASDAATEERRSAPIVRELRNAEEAIIATLNGEVIGDSSLLQSVL